MRLKEGLESEELSANNRNWGDRIGVRRGSRGEQWNKAGEGGKREMLDDMGCMVLRFKECDRSVT